MRFVEESSDDETLSGPVVDRESSGQAAEKSAMNRRRRIIESDSESESDGSGSNWDSGEEEIGGSPAPGRKEGHLPESPVEIDLGSLSLKDVTTQRGGTSIKDSESPCLRSPIASAFSDRDPGVVSTGGDSYSTSCRSVADSGDDSQTRFSRREKNLHCSPDSSTTSADDTESRHSAWTYDDASDEYFLTGMVDAIKGEVLWPRLRIPRDLYNCLYDHQKVGVQWMASLHNGGIGGILGDDMGLGKTYQTLTFLGGLMVSRTIRSALICCPVSLLRSWESEAQSILNDSLGLDVSIQVISSDVSKKKRSELLNAAMNCSYDYPHLAITTYGLVTSNPLDFIRTEEDIEKLAWNYVILDEGHKIKNPSTKTTKACHRICRNERTRRLLLTGTPIQNNLKELWTLFDWATSSKLLGKLPNFNNRFAQPIEAGRHKNASDGTIAIATKANEELQSRLRPHFLQRLKSVEFKDELPSKREIVVWTHLSEKQRQLYEDYVENGGNVRSILAGEISSPLEAITWLKKLCGHPLLVSWSKDDWDMLHFNEAEPETLLQDSAKLNVLRDLLTRLHASGHRTLVFSQSTKMLNLIEMVLPHLSLARIDGSTKERDRQRTVDKFNKSGSRYSVLLLSTKAAGLGLTLTGADRCVVYDPSWNPAEDSQAVDRCFRIGQSKKVTVYRFIAAGTVEERMYEKQVFKEGIKRAIMTNKGSSTERYFDKDDLRRLFQLAPEGCCEILQKIKGHDIEKGKEGKKDGLLVLGASGKPSFLDAHRHVVGLSSHDHLYNSAIAESSGTDPTRETQSTPFAGTPLKEHRRLGRAARALHGKRLDFEPAAMHSKPKGAYPDEQKHETSWSRASEARGGRKPLATIVDNDNTTKRSELEPVMSEQENAMKVLLDDLDSNTFKGQEKIQLHKNIVRLAIQLGWM